MRFNSCKNRKIIANSDSYPTPANENLWPQYSKDSTLFKLWSPNAEKVILRLFRTGNDSEPYVSHSLNKINQGIWQISVTGDLNGTYYTFSSKRA